MANRLFLSLSDEELRCFETARELLGMNRSQYLRYLMTDQKEIRPVELTHRELIQKLSCIERDLKVIAMKKELGEQERMSDMIKGIIGENSLEDIERNESVNDAMFVITNEQKFHGAAAIFYGDCLERLAEKMKSDMYILPSSIHEMLHIPESSLKTLKGSV